MQVWLDGKVVEVPRAVSLAELLCGVSPHVDPDRTVTGVEVDGRAVDHADPAVASAFRLGGGETVRVVTETPLDFARSRRAAMGEYLDAIAQQLEAAALGLRAGDAVAGNRLLAEASRDLGLVLELDRSLCALDAAGTRCAAVVDVLERIGAVLTDAERERRWSDVADILCADLVPAIRAVT
jgi:hypothetical protein